MSIKDLFKEKTVFSFEVFPPKKDSPIEIIYNTLDELNDLSPDFISVTFSAGGSSNNSHALDIASRLKERGVTPMIHLPCINYTKAEIEETLKQIKERGIENILALRGDINPEIPPKEEIKEDIGHSPDWRDMFLMRSWFDYNEYDIPDNIERVLGLT